MVVPRQITVGAIDNKCWLICLVMQRISDYSGLF